MVGRVVCPTDPGSCVVWAISPRYYEGGSVSLSCPYDPENQNNQKYMCRGNRPSTCLQQAVVTSNNKQTGQYSLTDDKERRTFTVTITGLAQRDSGLYLCGVHRNTGLDVFSAVEAGSRGCWDILVWFRLSVECWKLHPDSALSR
uniref:Immunoglobulin V-set domain-containing protein n=1 Tax=Monopterus albus TaxID=43700 RepID=A0A3Q3IQ16_MONAL